MGVAAAGFDENDGRSPASCQAGGLLSTSLKQPFSTASNLPRLSWHWWRSWPNRLLLVGVIVTFPFALFCAGVTLAGRGGFDWGLYVTATERAMTGGAIYEWSGDYAYAYSPVFAYLFAAVSWLGLDIWRFAHVGAAFLLPNWPMRVMTVISWPFWFEMQYGNLVVFVLLAGAWALRGSRPAALAYLALTVLIPRPLMLPLAVWLLWKDPWLRLPFAGMAFGSIIFAAGTGYLEPWIGSLLETPEKVYTSDVNFSPSRFIGSWWILLGAPIAFVLLTRGRIGWASLALSPYLWPQYFLFAFLELVEPAHRFAAASRESAAPRYPARQALAGSPIRPPAHTADD